MTHGPMPQTGFILRVPQAEARVAELRERFDASAALGVPAHITLLFPFMAPEAIDSTVLQGIRDALAGACAFDFVLASAARFPATAYLAPEPAGPFIDLTDRLVRRFPAYPPFGGEFATVIPHLTVAHGDAALAEAAHAGAGTRARSPRGDPWPLRCGRAAGKRHGSLVRDARLSTRRRPASLATRQRPSAAASAVKCSSPVQPAGPPAQAMMSRLRPSPLAR